MVKKVKISNKLIIAIAEKKWCEVYRYLNEAMYPDCNNTYPLHEICNDSTAPMNILTDIYYAYPNAALTTDDHQDTPIAIAVEAGFEDAVHFLAKVCPEACSIGDSEGSTPILSVIYCLKSNKMINSMILANPEAAFVRDNEGDNAFDYFFRHWNVFMRIVVHNPIMCDKDLDYLIGHGDWNVRDIYQQTCLFLKAANLYRRGKILDDTCLLHCALREESCHWAFCKLLMKLYPEQILTRDFEGNLPISIITASKELSDEETFLCFDCFTKENKLVHAEFINGDRKYCCKNCLEREPENSIMKTFHIRPVLKVYEIVKELLSIAPQMVLISDSQGNYPINIAIRNHHSYDIVHQLFKALPETGKIRDVKTRLLPFMLAAMGIWKSEIDQITITYQLLREDPYLVFGV